MVGILAYRRKLLQKEEDEKWAKRKAELEEWERQLRREYRRKRE